MKNRVTRNKVALCASLILSLKTVHRDFVGHGYQKFRRSRLSADAVKNVERKRIMATAEVVAPRVCNTSAAHTAGR